jgi:GNAT superfamily N-acetyltransferase
MLRVVEWEPSHQGLLDQALGPPDDLCGQARSFFGPSVATPHWRLTLVAELDGVPVGAAVLFESHWHPQRLWVSVEVAEAHRRRGIGTTLLASVRERSRPDGRPLRAKVFIPSAGAVFAAAHGFQPIQRSRTFRLEHRALPLPSDVDLQVEMPASVDDAADAFRQFYVTTHDWDPPGPITIDDILTSHINGATVTMVVRDTTGEPLAAACLYDEAGEVLLSGGPTNPAHPSAEAAAAALLDAAPRPLLIEVDDSVPALLAALHRHHPVVVDEVHLVSDGPAP